MPRLIMCCVSATSFDISVSIYRVVLLTADRISYIFQPVSYLSLIIYILEQKKLFRRGILQWETVLQLSDSEIQSLI